MGGRNVPGYLVGARGVGLDLLLGGQYTACRPWMLRAKRLPWGCCGPLLLNKDACMPGWATQQPAWPRACVRTQPSTTRAQSLLHCRAFQGCAPRLRSRGGWR